MLDTLKNAALAALVVFALLYATGTADHSSTHASASPARTYPSTASEKRAGQLEAQTSGAPKCSYDGDFTNDPQGCK